VFVCIHTYMHIGYNDGATEGGVIMLYILEYNDFIPLDYKWPSILSYIYIVHSEIQGVINSKGGSQ